MPKSFFIALLCTAILTQNLFSCLNNWTAGQEIVLQPTARKPSRTAVLIISPPSLESEDYTTCRWKLGKKVWEVYMNSTENVDCYFLQSTYPNMENEDQLWIDNNTIYFGNPRHEVLKSGKISTNDQILHKTMLAVEKLLPEYTHFF